MKSLKSGNNLITSGILFFVLLAFFLSISLHPAFAQDQPITNTTDLSAMDWSDDEPTEKKKVETDLSTMDWSDDDPKGKTGGDDLSNMDWSDDETTEKKKTDDLSDLSNMSWQDDDEGARTETEEKGTKVAVEELTEEDIAKKESRIHFYGFLLFIGYILGGVLTGYFTRNRKLAVDYPPELLILLHTVWPVEWLFMIFAGKKVR